MTAYDTIILGSSPNALAAAGYLAKAGRRVLVLEPGDKLGGAASTAEFAPGFRADVGLIGGRIDPRVAGELGLADHGLEVIERDSLTSLLPGGRGFTLPADPAAAAEAIGGFAPADAERYGAFVRLLAMAADLLRAAYAGPPPQAHQPSPLDLSQLAALAGQLHGYGRRDMTEVIRLLVMPVRDLLEEWFASAELRGLLAGPAIRGLTQGPFAGGTTFNLLHHLAIGDGYFRASARGGVGAIAGALAAAAQANGAELRTNVGPLKVALSDSAAIGVRLDTGEVLSAAQVVSDFDARHTFTHLVDPPELTPEFNRALRNVRYNGAVARVNLALRELPEFPGLPDGALRGTLARSPSVEALERAFDAAKRGGLAEQPYLEATIPTLADPTLAPDGQHVMQIWLQYAPYRAEIDPARVRELALDCLSDHAPGLRALVLHAQVLTPHDLADQLSLSEGHLYGGDMTLDQAFFLRPLPGYAQYRTPIEGLFLCGAATHPGGGVSGLAGRNLASVLTDQ
jgi:phytoene dehydrogenase-like protein